MALDKEQELARTITNSSVVVSASAGAGKTSVLVKRLLKRCIEDRVELDHILAMTFTKAAAEEMKKRLAVSLNEALANATDPQETKYIENQLVKLSDAAITTIDSYCLTIIQKYYSVIGLDPASCKNILDDSTSSMLKHQAFLNTMSDLIQHDKKTASMLANFFSARCEDYDALENTLFTIVNYALSGYDPGAFFSKARDYFKPVKRLNDFPEEILHVFYDDLIVKIENMQDTLEQMKGVIDETSKVDPDTLQKKSNMLANCRNALLDKQYARFCTTLEDTVLFDTTPDTKNIPYKALREELNKQLKEMLAECYSEDTLTKDASAMSPFVYALLDLAQNVQKEFAKIKKENVCMDFTDMERFALDILNASNGAIADLLRQQFDEIMVDEFQDTSTLQNSIIEKIARPDNVFRVGDVKQSIYRFRQAKPSLMRSLQHDPSQTCINLRHNYRSKQSIVEFNNMLFAKLMNIDGFADEYTALDTVSIGRKEQEEDPVPVTFAFVNPSDSYPDLNKKEYRAYWIAEQMIRMHEQGYHFRDFCVLVRSHNTKMVLRSAFEKYGIPYEIDTREGFFNSMLCLEMQEIIHSLLDPNNAIAMTAVLTSGLYDLDDTELASLKIGHSSLLEGVREDRPDILEDLRHFKEVAEKQSVIDMLHEIACKNDYYDHLPSHEQANFDFLLEKVNNLHIYDLYTFLTMMQNGTDENSSEASSRSRDDDAVGVTTIHQSKGLQYKVVFLWCDSKNLFQDGKSKTPIHDELMLGIPYYDPDTRLFRETVQSRAVKHAIDMEDQQEYIRLLYVALTRAEERMFLVDFASDKPQPESISRSVCASRKGMTALLMGARRGNTLFTIEDVYLHGLNALPVLSQSYASTLPSRPTGIAMFPPVIIPSSTECKELPPLGKSTSANGQNYGSYVHACFEDLPLRLWTTEDLDRYDLKETTKKNMLTFSESDIYKKCLAMEIHKEMPFFTIDRTNNRTITGAMDFVAWNDKEIILIDYKTDHADEDTIRSRYTDQITEYKNALLLLHPGKTLHAYAFSLHNNTFIEI